MDVIPMCSIFQELQIVHDTGYFSALPSLEEYWQQVTRSLTARRRARVRCSPGMCAVLFFSCREGSWRWADSCVPTRKCQSCSCSSAFALMEAFTPVSPVSDVLACACRGSYASSLNDRFLQCTCNQPELRKRMTFRAQIAEYHENIFRLVVLV